MGIQYKLENLLTEVRFLGLGMVYVVRKFIPLKSCQMIRLSLIERRIGIFKERIYEVWYQNVYKLSRIQIVAVYSGT